MCRLFKVFIGFLNVLISASSRFVLWVGGHSPRKHVSVPGSEYVFDFKCS